MSSADEERAKAVASAMGIAYRGGRRGRNAVSMRHDKGHDAPRLFIGRMESI